MHYELYLDSLFLLNFGMNLLLLCLVDHSMGHTATWYRLLAGAGVGAGWDLFSFLWSGICFLFYGKEQPPGSCCFVFCRGQYLCCM
ncbi:unknown [Clostridium sp. CAG:91]|nr:unknown [Clostridium sp. CAG:91]